MGNQHNEAGNSARCNVGDEHLCTAVCSLSHQAMIKTLGAIHDDAHVAPRMIRPAQ